MASFYHQQEKVKIYHGSTNSTRPFHSGRPRYVDVSSLGDVIEISVDGQYAIVEPNVPLDQLVAATQKVGLIPPMVAEFPGITVGGAISGGSGESSSFKWGLFHDICLEYEVVLGNAEIRQASRTVNADLFWGMACAFGSLGIVTLVKVKLVPATKYVRLRYRRTANHQDALAQLETQVGRGQDFVDGILFSKTNGVIMTGSYTNEASLPVARFSRAYDDWFYVHAQKISQRHDDYEEIIPLRDYLFRYDRGGFWAARYAFRHLPFNRLSRFLLAGFFKTRTLFKILQGSNYAYRVLAQDISLPADQAIPFLDYVDTACGIYPLWLCPLKPGGQDFLSPNAISAPLVVNVGVWGELKPSAKTFKERNRELEKLVGEMKGRKVLYAHAYYSEAEFWQIYDRPSYQTLRQKYHAEATFPDVLAKTSTPSPDFAPSQIKGLLALVKSPYKLR